MLLSFLGAAISSCPPNAATAPPKESSLPPLGPVKVCSKLPVAMSNR